MKTRMKIFTTLAFVAMYISNISAQIKIESDGDIGLGTSTPTSNVELKGNNMKISFPSTSNHIRIQAYAGSTPIIEPSSNGAGYLGYNTYWNKTRTYIIARTYEQSLSDKKFKKNIKPIDSTLILLNKLKPVQYDFDPAIFNDVSDKKMKSNLIELGKQNYGLIAQEVEKVMPHIVSYDSVMDGLTVSYSQLIPVIIKAVQEQQSIIAAQSLKIKELEDKVEGTSTKENKNANLKSASVSIDTEILDVTTNAFLFQNTPNPFTYNTEIKYYLPEGSNNAVLYFFNLQGNLLMTEKISGTGNGSITINGSELNPGMYVYSLLIDGQEVATKRMILTD